MWVCVSHRIDVCMYAMIVEESWAAWLFVWWTELKCMLGVWNVGLTKHRYEYVNRSLSYTIINISTIAIDSQQSVDSAHISIHLILAIAEMNRLCVCWRMHQEMSVTDFPETVLLPNTYSIDTWGLTHVDDFHWKWMCEWVSELQHIPDK